MIVSKGLIAVIAPEFVLHDTEGRAVRLSDFKGKKNIILVFNRGLG
jgi:peroxiredoxin